MTRILEVIFRQPIRLLTLCVLLISLSVAIAYILPRSYQTKVSLWALRRYEIISTTGPEADLLSTPAQTQSRALSELLQSREFALAVAKSAKLASTLSLPESTLSNPQLLDETLFQEVSLRVETAAQGYNLYTISYANSNPQVAQQVVAAVIDNYGLRSQDFSILEAENLLNPYQEQLITAKQDADAAVNAESQYLMKHPELAKPGAVPLNDPKYALLDSQRLQAQSTVETIQSRIVTLKQQINTQNAGTNTLFKVLDSPLVASSPVSRMKLVLTAGAIGLAVALLACTLYIVILLRRDRTVHSLSQLQNTVNYPVLMQFPMLNSAAKEALSKR